MTRKSLCVIKFSFSAHARDHASGYNNEFSLPRADGLEIFQNKAHNSNEGRPMCVWQFQSLSTPNLLVLGVQRHLVTWSTSLKMLHVFASFCVGYLYILIE